MARLLIIGGGRRGLQLAREIEPEGHATRIVTRSEEHRSSIEGSGAECWIGDPDRLATLRGVLEGVTIACWLLGSVSGSPEQIRALHGPRLRSFLGQAIDSTMRGFIYEAAGSAPAEILAEGEWIAREECTRNAIPLAVLRTAPSGEALSGGALSGEAPSGGAPSGEAVWREESLAAVGALLGGPVSR